MEQNIKKILDILTKDELKQEDKALLEKLIASDRDAKEFFKNFRRIEDLIKASTHISEEDLYEYILFKNKNTLKDVKISKIKLIEDHLKKCARCGSVYLQLSEEYSDIDNYVAGNFLKPEEQSSVTNAIKTSLFRYKSLRYSFVTASIVLVLFFSLIAISQLTTPRSYKLAEIENSSLNYVTRGRASSEFQKGLVALNNKKIDDAIDYFKKDISDNKNDETIFYTNYILGLTYLEYSEKDFLGLFISYDDIKVNQAKENFKESILKNNSGKFPDITANSYFFLAKADLMLNNIQQAKKDLQMVITLKGSRSDNAKELLNNLE